MAIGSTVWSGSEPWPPFPSTSILKVSADAFIGPSFIDVNPASKALLI